MSKSHRPAVLLVFTALAAVCNLPTEIGGLSPSLPEVGTAPASAPPRPSETSMIRWIDSETATWDRSRVGEARLVSATEGWVLTEGSLRWTSDGGDTWREVAVPTASDDLI